MLTTVRQEVVQVISSFVPLDVHLVHQQDNVVQEPRKHRVLLPSQLEVSPQVAHVIVKNGHHALAEHGALLEQP